jgi:hypothetical protein
MIEGAAASLPVRGFSFPWSSYTSFIMILLCLQNHSCVMDRLQTSGELQDKTSFIDPSTGVDLLKNSSPDYLFL